MSLKNNNFKKIDQNEEGDNGSVISRGTLQAFDNDGSVIAYDSELELDSDLESEKGSDVGDGSGKIHRLDENEFNESDLDKFLIKEMSERKTTVEFEIEGRLKAEERNKEIGQRKKDFDNMLKERKKAYEKQIKIEKAARLKLFKKRLAKLNFSEKKQYQIYKGMISRKAPINNSTTWWNDYHTLVNKMNEK